MAGHRFPKFFPVYHTALHFRIPERWFIIPTTHISYEIYRHRALHHHTTWFVMRHLVPSTLNSALYSVRIVLCVLFLIYWPLPLAQTMHSIIHCVYKQDTCCNLVVSVRNRFFPPSYAICWCHYYIYICCCCFGEPAIKRAWLVVMRNASQWLLDECLCTACSLP